MNQKWVFWVLSKINASNFSDALHEVTVIEKLKIDLIRFFREKFSFEITNQFIQIFSVFVHKVTAS